MNEVIDSPIDSPFAGQRSTAVAETSGSRQSQSRAMAETQTKYLMAQQFPRDEIAAMDRIITSFSRPGLAERSQYEYSKGGSSVSGPSIHSAQAIAQQWGNLEFGWSEISRGTGADGVPFSEVKAFATDLQSRTLRPLEFIVRHWRDTKSGGYRLKEEREIYELCANMAQRRVRACILAVIPQDVVDSAMEQAALTLKTKADTSPAAMAKMVEAFAVFSVTKDQIEKRIQRRLDAIQPAQVVQLKRIYASLRDEMSTAAEWFDIEAEAPTSSGVEAVKAAAKKAPAPKKSAPPEQAEQPDGDITYAVLADRVNAAASREIAEIVLDSAADLPEDQRADLARLVERIFSTTERKA